MILLQLATKLSFHYSIQKCNSQRVVLQVTNRFRTILYNYLYKIYPKLFGDDYKVLYMDTDSIYAKLNMTHKDYVKILEKNKDLFGKEIGNIEP